MACEAAAQRARQTRRKTEIDIFLPWTNALMGDSFSQYVNIKN
jgi:hypothetical protein